jgi:hypothetical protein
MMQRLKVVAVKAVTEDVDRVVLVVDVAISILLNSAPV